MLLVLAGCVSPNDTDEPVRRFRASAPVPVCLRVEDARPELAGLVERHREEWLYLRRDPAAQAGDLARLVGNALNAFGATPGYRIVKEDTPVDAWQYLIHLRYVEGYSRWPVEVDRNATTVAVEGSCEIEYTLYRMGREIHSGSVNARPNPFRLPLNMIQEDNVEKMVTESLQHQFNLARRNALEDLLEELAEEWPDYVKRK